MNAAAITRRLHHQAQCPDAKSRQFGLALMPGQARDVQGFSSPFRMIPGRVDALIWLPFVHEPKPTCSMVNYFGTRSV
ncbi:hypothetical protein [Sphingopyxis sp. MWB1]|uniref:hypothetical protein n=1 Tax=Sphingopyxis sp. MWB1 TaxID=1537715 RepID=UPI00051A1345|nr:hypothetical protein [Sphingopyxis sp. MWB1]